MTDTKPMSWEARKKLEPYWDPRRVAELAKTFHEGSMPAEMVKEGLDGLGTGWPRDLMTCPDSDCGATLVLSGSFGFHCLTHDEVKVPRMVRLKLAPAGTPVPPKNERALYLPTSLRLEEVCPDCKRFLLRLPGQDVFCCPETLQAVTSPERVLVTVIE